MFKIGNFECMPVSDGTFTYAPPTFRLPQIPSFLFLRKTKELEYGVSQLDIGSNLGFLQQWTPSSQPVDLGTLYVASYYVVTELARPVSYTHLTLPTKRIV